MIEEQLEQARLRSAKRILHMGIALFATICLFGLVFFGLSFLDFSTEEEVPVVAFDKEKLSEIDREKLRAEFKELLQQYENELEPSLLAANVEMWNRDALFEINELKKNAMSEFSSGEYLKAVDNLHSLKNRAVTILEEAEGIFKENIGKATSSLAEDRYDEAKLHIEKALMVAPQSPEALELQRKIEKLPHLLPLLEKAKVARAENDLQKEYDFIQQAVQLAPEREDVKSRLQVLKKLIKNQKFKTHISSGFAAIEKKKVKDARYHYREAKKVDSERKELSVLLSQLLSLEKSIRVQRAIQQAEQAVRRDDWQQARMNFAKAAKDAPENKSVVEGLRRADQVLGLLARFGEYFRNPYRLANSNVRSEAEQTLVQADTVSGYSFTVKRHAEQVRELVAKINRHIPVTVISDNKTYVQVRSVGKIGAVSEKIIQLKPGKYTFEGARDGFKSKLVQAFIPYDRDNFSVRVICDEPI